MPDEGTSDWVFLRFGEAGGLECGVGSHVVVDFPQIQGGQRIFALFCFGWFLFQKIKNNLLSSLNLWEFQLH